MHEIEMQAMDQRDPIAYFPYDRDHPIHDVRVQPTTVDAPYIRENTINREWMFQIILKIIPLFSFRKSPICQCAVTFLFVEFL